jgi:hypothetical protein
MLGRPMNEHEVEAAYDVLSYNSGPSDQSRNFRNTIVTI